MGTQPAAAIDAMQAILGVQTVDGFKRLVTARPGLLSRQTEQGIMALQSFEAFEAAAKMVTSLIRDARGDPRRAWESYDAAMRRAAQIGNKLEAEQALIDAALTAERYEEVVERTDASIPRAARLGSGSPLG